MRNKNKIVVVLIFGALLSIGQQQSLYTNFLLHQYVYNPAFIGTVNGQQINAGYRNQWLGFEGAPKTFLASVYGNLKKKPDMAFGAMVLSEQTGLMDITSFYGMYSYHLKLNKKAAINFGIGAGAVQYSVKTFNARAYDKDDDYLSAGLLTGFAFDANAGMYYYTKNFFAGISNQHMANGRIRWDNSLGKLTPHFYFYSGYNFRLGEKKEWVIQPSALMRTNAPSPYQMEYNLRITYKELVWLACNYRERASSSAVAGFVIDKQFTVAYAYDFALSSLTNYSSGTHEIMLSYFIPQKKKKSKSEQIRDADEEELNTIDNTIKTTIKAKKTEGSEQGGETQDQSKEKKETSKEKSETPK
jgi:type IX secretion system PorP/SprF family membrane protein